MSLDLRIFSEFEAYQYKHFHHQNEVCKYSLELNSYFSFWNIVWNQTINLKYLWSILGFVLYKEKKVKKKMNKILNKID